MCDDLSSQCAKDVLGKNEQMKTKLRFLSIGAGTLEEHQSEFPHVDIKLDDRRDGL